MLGVPTVVCNVHIIHDVRAMRVFIVFPVVIFVSSILGGKERVRRYIDYIFWIRKEHGYVVKIARALLFFRKMQLWKRGKTGIGSHSNRHRWQRHHEEESSPQAWHLVNFDVKLTSLTNRSRLPPFYKYFRTKHRREWHVHVCLPRR